jgi:hypothetical protein
MELTKRFTQNILPNMIIKAQDGLTNNIILDFKSFCSTSNSYKHAVDKFKEGLEVREGQVKRRYRAAVRNLNLMQNENPPGTTGPTEEILNAYGDRGSECTGLIIGEHGNLSTASLRIRDLIAKPLASRHRNYYCIAPHHAQGMFKREINRRWGLVAARAWARLLIERIHILVLGFDDETELGTRRANDSSTTAATYATATATVMRVRHKVGSTLIFF